jgi:heme/copper-type cytochrome/quinol oxidase subunit 2
MLFLALAAGVGAFMPVIGIIVTVVMYVKRDENSLNFTKEERFLLNALLIILIIYLTLNVLYTLKYPEVKPDTSSETSL